jgi:hypothetical protein
MFFRGSFEADLLWYFHPLELGKLQFWKYWFLARAVSEKG